MNNQETARSDLIRALSGLDVHDHLCLIYENREEQLAAVIPFIRMGLGRGEQCIYIIDENTQQVVLEAMRRDGIDVDSAIKSGALKVLTKREAYLREEYFDPDSMIRYLKNAVDSAKKAGFSALRVTTEMTWALGNESGVDLLIEYEAKLNYFIPKNDILAVCQYNRSRFKPEIIIDIIRTHPLVIYGFTVCKNFYYIPPDEFLKPKDQQAFLEEKRLLKNIIERKRTEDANFRLASIVEFSFDAIIGKTMDGIITSWNPAAEKLYGYSEREVLGKSISILIPPGHFDEMPRILERIKYGETIEHYEAVRLRKDGNQIYVFMTISPIKDADGRIIGASTIAHDITEHKKMESQLSAASLYARNLIETSLDPLVTISIEGKITDVNKATESVTGFSREELIGRDFSDYFTEPENARKGYQEVFEKGFVRDYPLAIKHISGEITYVLYNATVYRSEEGKVQGVFAAARDITERKRLDEQLHSASLYARNLIETSLDPLVTISSEGKITDVNKATESVTGFSREELIGRDFSDYFTEPENARKGYQEVFEKGFVRDYPLAIRHTSGTTIDVLYNAAVYKDATGNVAGVFAAARDITKRKRAENELRHAHDELEIRVRERTSELAITNEALKAEIAQRKNAQENLTKSLNEKELLIKEVHHRVKNNLQIVSSMLELQSTYMKDKQAIMAFREGQNRVSTMALIHEKLYRSGDLARIRFAEYIEELTSNIFASYGVNSDKIRLMIKVGDVFFDVNTAIPCGLIINELVSNSIKHAFPDGRTGEINIELQPEADEKYLLTVSDNGKGFPSDLDFRNSLSLGLKLVITLTKQLGGTIELNRSAGTSFIIKFSEIKYKLRG